MLGSIASGKWVLHPSYMAASMAAGKLLPERDYEWGAPANAAKFAADLKSDMERKLSAASHRWRVARAKSIAKCATGRVGAFTGIKAVLHTSKSRANAFRNLLTLGGGEVLDTARPPYSDLRDATHVLAEPNKMPGVSLDYKALAARGVAVVGPVFMNEFLVSDPAPRVEDFLLEEYKSFWANRRK